MSKKKEIISGYKGIMELDITDIPSHLKKDTVERHMKDIDEYKREQYKLKPHLRYENTIERIEKTRKESQVIHKNRIDLELQQQIEHNAIYNKLKKKD